MNKRKKRDLLTRIFNCDKDVTDTEIKLLLDEIDKEVRARNSNTHRPGEPDWNGINRSMNPEQREAFMVWLLRLWMLANRLDAEMLDLPTQEVLPQQVLVGRLYTLISICPFSEELHVITAFVIRHYV
jgi:hypothetical protein